jgi:hypothetical protein
MNLCTGIGIDDLYDRKIKGIGVLEKIIGKENWVVVEPYIAKSNPTPAIVPESARGRAVNRDSEVASDFGEEE